ncbi:MAG TPA: hypothetical protein VEV83_15675 [Parafilimonas sp.]|jgi:hypothetical protein|nr:hypothetical protein [Parafilimonas sp.]
MKKNVLNLAAFLCLLISCSKSVNNRVENTGSSSVQFISVNGSNDSTTYNYSFDEQGYLVKQQVLANTPVLYPVWEYTRDEQKRIIKITRFGSGDTLILNVNYANGNEVSYAVEYSSKDPSKITDSMTYEYADGKVQRLDVYLSPTASSEQATYYFTYEYAASNLSKVHSFWLNDGTYSESLGFDFEYDDKVNPLFSPDDIFMGMGIGGGASYISANNVTRQTNHYGVYDDYVTYDFTYDSDNRPVSVTWSGPGIATMYGYYFYQ